MTQHGVSITGSKEDTAGYWTVGQSSLKEYIQGFDSGKIWTRAVH